MWPFKKRKEIVDLTHLGDKVQVRQTQDMAKELDLTSQTNQVATLTETGAAASVSSGGEGALGFLGSLAGSSGSSDSSSAQSTSSRTSSSFSDSSFSGLKNKIEDVEYKLQSLSKRIGQILDRLELVERKADRNTR